MLESLAESLAADIPLETARAAHRGTSHTPDQRGDQERRGYAATLLADLDALGKLATTDAKRATLATLFDAYRAGYRERTIALLAAKAACVSTMIAGPSKFNVGRARKASDRADGRLSALMDYRARQMRMILKALQPELAAVRTEDDDALDRLEVRIARREARQAMMAAANRAIRAHAKDGADRQVAELVDLGLPESIARALLKPDFAGRLGFADFELKNNSAEIRRLKARVVTVAAAQTAADVTEQRERARLEISPSDNRVRLHFPDKPATLTRETLKGYGFRWAPTVGAWQAYYNVRAIGAARQIAGEIVTPAAEAATEPAQAVGAA